MDNNSPLVSAPKPKKVLNINLADILTSNTLMPTTYTNHATTMTILLPSFKIEDFSEDTGTGIRITFNEMPIDDIASTIDESVDLQPYKYDLSRLTHSFTFSVLADHSDVCLKKMLNTVYTEDIRRNGEQNIPDGWNLTPDLVETLPGHVTIIEFATTTGNSRGSVERLYLEKMAKYSSITDRIRGLMPKTLVRLFVIAVGSHELTTNFKLEDNVKDSLIYRYRVSKAIQSHLIIMKRIDAPHERNKTSDIADLVGILRAYSVDNVGEREFKKSNYNKCIGACDKELVQKLTAKCFEEAIKTIRNTHHDPRKPEQARRLGAESLTAEIKKHFEEVTEKNNEFNKHMKSIINVPFLNLKPGKASINVKSRVSLLDNIGKDIRKDSTFTAWKLAIDQIPNMDEFSKNDDDYFDELNILDEEIISDEELNARVNNIQSIEKKPYKFKRTNRRVTIHLKDDDAIELAKVGIEAKKKIKKEDKESAIIKTYRDSKKLSFELADKFMRSDIDPFFNSNGLRDIFMKQQDSSSSTLNVEYLVRRALKIYHSKTDNLPDEYVDSLRNITKTPLFNMCKIISDIGTELVLSLRQNTDDDQFIIKKIKDYDLFLLIKTTKLSSAIFFSLLWFNADNIIPDQLNLGNVFRTAMTNGRVSWTQFISANQSKLENWVLMESRILSLMPYWSEFHGDAPFTTTDKYSIETMKMTMLSFLVAMADKPEIEQEMSLFRYIFMKGFQVYPVLPNPEVLIRKFNKNPKSRLTIWVQHKMIEYISDKIIHPISIRSSPLNLEGSQATNTNKYLEFKNLTNPYFNYELVSPGQCINIAYIGYVQNKNLKPEANVLGKLMSKILIYEKEFTEKMKSEIGQVNKEEFKDVKHMYNIDLIKDGCDNFKIWMSKVYGESSMDDLGDQIDEELSRATLMEVFTTLKASSTFNEDLYIYKDNMSYSRTKVIQAVQKHVHREKTRVQDILYECIETLKRKKCMDIDIFMKNQHGGIREIYVLGFEERVVQWFIEKISRIMCEKIPTETMTHPDSKRTLPHAHSASLRTKLNGQTITVATSADAEKWNQNHYVHKFAIVLVRLLPERYHGIVWTILHMWTEKHIMIPMQLLDQIYKNPKTEYYDGFVGDLSKVLHGDTISTWAAPNTTYIKTQTGFMQGILHYTSSFFHAMINIKVEKSIKFFMHASLGHYPVSLIMQSSDDSCHILSCQVGEDLYEALRYLYISLRFKSIYGAEVGIRNSFAKEVIQGVSSYEYNSAFQIGSSRHEPDLKLLYASTQTADHESFTKHQEEMYNQMGGFINVGGSVHIANYIQLSHAFLHYRYLGSSVTRDFTLYAGLLIKMPDPSLGFKILDNPKVCGLPGFQYGVYKLVSGTAMKNLFKHRLIDISKIRTPEQVELTKARKATEIGIISFGNRAKYLKLKESMDLYSAEEWNDKLNKTPAIFFRDARTPEEFKIKCSIKMCQPGVADKLSTGSSITRRIAACVYVINHPVMTRISIWGEIERDKSGFDNEKGEDLLPVKHSLGEAAKDQWRILKSEASNLFLTTKDYKFLFPFYDEYVELDEKLLNYKNISFKKKPIEYRRVYTIVSVFKKDTPFSIPPGTVCKDIWFQYEDSVRKSNFPIDTIKLFFKHMSERIGWLSETIEKSLEKSPFRSIPEMMEWINSYSYKTRSMAMIGVPVSKRQGQTNLETLIRQNFSKFYRMVIDEPNPNRERNAMGSFRDLKTVLVRALTFPFNKDICDDIIHKAFMEFGNEIPYNHLHGSSRANTLHIMKKAVFSTPCLESIQILNMLNECKMGIYGSWFTKQTFDKELRVYKGPGNWKGKIAGNTAEITVASKIELNPKRIESYVLNIRIKENLINNPHDFICLFYIWANEARITVDTEDNHIINARHSPAKPSIGGKFKTVTKTKLDENTQIGTVRKRRILKGIGNDGVNIYHNSDVNAALDDIDHFRVEVAKVNEWNDIKKVSELVNLGTIRLIGVKKEKKKPEEEEGQKDVRNQPTSSSNTNLKTKPKTQTKWNRERKWRSHYKNNHEDTMKTKEGGYFPKGELENGEGQEEMTLATYRVSIVDNQNYHLNFSLKGEAQTAWINNTDVPIQTAQKYVKHQGEMSPDGRSFMREILLCRFAQLGYRQYESENIPDLRDLQYRYIPDEIPEQMDVNLQMFVNEKFKFKPLNSDSDSEDDTGTKSESYASETVSIANKMLTIPSEEECRARFHEDTKGILAVGWLEAALLADFDAIGLEDDDMEFAADWVDIIIQTEHNHKNSFKDIKDELIRTSMIFREFTGKCMHDSVARFFKGNKYQDVDVDLLYLGKFLFPDKKFEKKDVDTEDVSLF